jgi:hypothetical protein
MTNKNIPQRSLPLCGKPSENGFDWIGGYLSWKKEKVVHRMRRPVPPNDGTGLSVILIEIVTSLILSGVLC